MHLLSHQSWTVISLKSETCFLCKCSILCIGPKLLLSLQVLLVVSNPNFWTFGWLRKYENKKNLFSFLWLESIIIILQMEFLQFFISTCFWNGTCYFFKFKTNTAFNPAWIALYCIVLYWLGKSYSPQKHR